jgi:chromosome segregation ATPase
MGACQNSRSPAFWDSMKNRMGIIILTVACVGLAIALVVSQTNASKDLQKAQQESLDNSNHWVETTEKLDDQRKVNISLTNDLASRVQDLAAVSNQMMETSNTLAKTEDSLKVAQDEVAKRDSEITDLESQNKALDQRAMDLTNSIVNLQGQIDDTQKKLAASEGDKTFLQKELQRLMSEKAELERQFNDLKVVRAQVAKLKEELAISRRLAWIREGVFAREDEKAGQVLMQKSPATASARPAPKKPNYDLNVEVDSDGTVRVIPPLTNSAPTNLPSQ